jgi:hypothetical protein
MRRAGPGPAAALALLLSACTASAVPIPQPPPPTAGHSDDQVADVIGAAFEADARFDPADSLYEPEAEIIANGERRFAPPRYAGMEAGGAVAIGASRVEFRGGLAWAVVEYRWISTAAGRAREGRATFLLVPDDKGAWRIRHAHSSSPEDDPPQSGSLPLGARGDGPP